MKNLKINVLFLIIVIQPFLDVIAFFQQNGSYAITSFVTRVLILIVSILYVYIKLPKSQKKSFLILYFILAFLSSVHVLNSYRINGLNLIPDFSNLIRTLYLPILSINICYYIKIFPNSIKFIKKGICINIISILMIILMNVLSGDIIHTYSEGYGLRGWFYNSNSQGVILALITPLFLYYSFQRNNVIIKILAILASFFLLYSNGTSGCYMMLVPTLVLGAFLDLFGSFKSKYRIITFLCTLLIIGTFVFYKNSPSYQIDYQALLSTNTTRENINLENNSDKEVDDIINNNVDQKDKIYPFEKKYEEQNIRRYFGNQFVDDFGIEEIEKLIGENYTLDKFINNRYRKKLVSKVVFKNSDIYTKIIGCNFYSINKYDVDMESDITAILYYYGYLGMLVFVLFVGYFIYLIIKKLLFKSGLSDFEFLSLSGVFLTTLVAAEFSGSLLRRPNASIYVALVLGLIYYNTLIKEKR